MHGHGSFWADPVHWVLIAFIIFFVIFGKKLWGALAAMLDERASKIQAELNEAQRLRSEAEAMLKDAEKQRTQAIADAKALIDGAQAEASRLAAATAAEAEASAKRREQMAIDRISAAEKAAVDDVRRIAVDVATAAAGQVIAQGLNPQDGAVLIDQAIAGLPTALAQRRAA